MYDTVNKRRYVTSKARLASQRHLWMNVDLSNPINTVAYPRECVFIYLSMVNIEHY